RLTKAAEAALLGYRFPGNVRELENILERALTLCSGDEIDVADIRLRPGPDETSSQRSGGAAMIMPESGPLEAQLEEIERKRIIKALEQTRYNKTAAAQILGISFRQQIGRAHV